jgi:GH43 family beta-xylosidase
VGPTYVTGLVTAPVGADLTAPGAWTKLNYPVLKTDVAIGEWGPGHNIFTHDEDGNLLLVYHAKSGPRTPDRHTGLRRVHWAADGMPILDMALDEEVAPALRRVAVTVRVVAGDPGR